MKLSIAIIAKNEEKDIGRCLRSVQGADEIVVCDTGSSDKTVEIAEKYAKVYTDYKWNDHFAEARNHSLSKCSGDWIFTIDCDDYLESDISELYEEIEKAEKQGVETIRVKEIGRNSWHYFPHLFRKGLYFKGAAHNYLETEDYYNSNIVIKRGYSPTHKKDPDRTLRILKKEVSKNPNKPRELYYLAREYWYRKNYITAIYWWERYLSDSKFLAEKADAHLYLARCYWFLSQGPEARKHCLQAININANFKEALAFMAEISWEHNADNWREYANIANNNKVLFVRKTEIFKPMSFTQEQLEYFKSLLISIKPPLKVLEWGSGFSTRYFPEFLQGEGVDYLWDSVEHDPKWFKKVKSWDIKNVTLLFADVNDLKAYVDVPFAKKYNLIFVDGRNRVACLEKAKELLLPKGNVILHDSERTKYQQGFEGYTFQTIGSSPQLWHGQLKIEK